MNGHSDGGSEGVGEGRTKGDGNDGKGRKMSLLDLLVEAELSSYHTSMKTKLKLRHAEHLKFVTEDDLAEIGMSKPEQRRLWKTFHRHFPVSLVAKIKKKVFGRGHETPEIDRKRFATADKQASEQHIIPITCITLCKQLGEGEFGAVWQGVWQSSSGGVQVAVKCVASEKLLSNPLSFLQEAAIMHRINHAHIVRLFGVVLDTKEIMLVTELAPLRSLLECLKERALRASFPVERLCEYVDQICEGMCYLEGQRLIHRDLAARNILVFSAEKVKISDFGLSRSLGVGEDYYRSNFSVSLKLPIAWCAPEAINFLKFTSASDVWALGVTMWEMFSYGFQPWVGMTGAQILSAIDSPRSQRLEQPDACPQEYYSLMLQCWEHDPNNRPKFADIRSVLPEIQPQRVRSISACNDGQMDHLQYAKDELITVLSKRPREYPDGYYWRGVVKSGRTGLFLPSNTIAHIGAEYPSSMLTSVTDSSASSTLMNGMSHLKSSFGRADKKKKPLQRITAIDAV
uniref:non-specific protein-tyrosine kinase n=1 Tax=Plectus sambesii TaxID=2011161 RepID=A0A914XQZ6_9BILA